VTAANPTASAVSVQRLPSLAGLAARRSRLELKMFLRDPTAVGFTMLFPVLLLVLFGSIFSGNVEGTDVSYSQVYVAGIIGSSIMSVGFVSLSIAVATERDSGELKRLAGTPLPRAAYFIGKVVMVLVTALVNIGVMIVVGILLFDLKLPTDARHWFTFAWVFVLGVGVSTLLGLAVGGMVPTAKSAPAVVNVPFVALQFISGVFVPIDQLPTWLAKASGIFPLRWICQGMRSVFLPDEWQVNEPGGSWQHGLTALVLGIWLVVGAALAGRAFRFTDRR
jgi:ABC-2 type transport system permease protein